MCLSISAPRTATNFILNTGPLSNLTENIFEGKSALWDDQVKHDTYDDYWKARNLAPHMKNIHCAVLTVGGWFDAEDLQGPFSTFHAIDKNNPGIFNALVMGPWVHGGWARYDGDHLGRVEFASNTGEYYRKNILFPFFEQYLKGNGDAKLPKAYVFETGTNVWRQYSAWPPKNAEAKTLYFHASGDLSFDAPAPESAAFDEYVSDPAKPVPFVSYAALNVPQEYMLSDQRFADSRTDVLVYQTPVLQEDVTIAGPISPRLFVSTTGTDSDWDVKLIDVYPTDYPDSKQDAPRPEDKDKPRKDVGAPAFNMGGYQQLVRGEPFRGKFRHSFEKPEPFTPGKVEEINFTMPGHQPHLPPRTPHHGADPEFVVPAHRPQSADLREHSRRQAVGLRESNRAGVSHESAAFRNCGAGAARAARSCSRQMRDPWLIADAEESFHDPHIGRLLVIRQAIDEDAPVLLLQNPIVEQHQQTTVMQ